MLVFRLRKWALPFLRVTAALSLCTGTFGPALAHSGELFKGKQIQLLVGYSAGGGYDIYARTVARYLPKFIPGHPSIVVQNMPGAGGLKVANYMYSQAPRDGTVIALTDNDLVVAPVLGMIDPHNVKYNPSKFFWLANMNSDVSVAVFRNDAGVRSLADLRAKQHIVGSTGLPANNAVYPLVMNNVLHTKLKVVAGYPGVKALTLALERGEIQGIGGWTWSGIMVSHPQWIRDKTIVPVLQLSSRKLPELPQVPSIMAYVKNGDERQALKLIFSPDIIGRPFFAPPGVPAETGGVLRSAFVKLARDPQFRAAATKERLEIDFMDGAKLSKLVGGVANAPVRVLALAKKMIRPATAKDESIPR